MLRIAGVAVAIAFAVVVVVSLVGGDDDDAQAKETDGAFIAGMVPHHESAVDMAEMALEKAQHPETKQLARDIVSAQTSEIEILEDAHVRLFDETLASMSGSHGDLGLSQQEMGMSHDMAELEEADPFDKTFIDMMIPHHQGAIRMARVELDRGDDAEMAGLAEAIVTAQSREIEQMNEWRTEWYGSESPAGGVPQAGEDAPSHEDMGH